MTTCKAVWPNYSYKNNEMTFTHSHTYKWLLSGVDPRFFFREGVHKNSNNKNKSSQILKVPIQKDAWKHKGILFICLWLGYKRKGVWRAPPPPPLNYQPVCLSSTLGNWWLNVWFLRPTWRSDAGSGLLPSIAENLSWRGDGRSSCTFMSALIVWFLQGIQSYRRQMKSHVKSKKDLNSMW